MSKPSNARWPRVRRRWLAVVGALLLIFGGFISWVAYGLANWDGSDITITNGCGFEIYMVDAHDGLRLAAGQSLKWSYASESGEKKIRVWRVTAADVTSGDALDVELHGDSTLSGADCPA